jgi:DNA invertase Pin-like site-specific DNA recombinase
MEVSKLIYAYIRVSTKQQKIDRQYEEIKTLNIDDKNIYIDKESGKDFDRTNYKKLIKKIKKDDLLIVKSIDRLGRNYKMILDEWAYITKVKEADIKVLDMPLLDTRIEGKNLVGKFISDIVLQVLSFVAENERNNIRERQAEGISIAKDKGVKFGRPKVITPPNTNEILDKYINHEITNTEAASILGVSRGTFFRLVKERKCNPLYFWHKKMQPPSILSLRNCNPLN